MKISKLLLAVVAAGVLLGAFVSSASARNFSVSEQRFTALWTTWTFSGGFGNVVCEVKLSGSLHTRTNTKTINSLIGFTTEATVLRCARGGATIRQESLPWHRRNDGFTGTLPNITRIITTNTGFSAAIREPLFGILCNILGSGGSIEITPIISAGTWLQAAVKAVFTCGSFEGSLEGTTSNVTNGAGARITVTLI